MPYGESVKTRALLVLAAVGAVLLSGCTSGGNQPPAASSAPASPTPIFDTQANAALQDAMAKSSAGSYRLSGDIEYTATGGATQRVELEMQTDPKAQQMSMAVITSGTRIEMRVIGTDFYVAGMPGLGKKWARVDGTKVAGLGDLFTVSDQNFALLKGVVELSAGPNGVFQGVIASQTALDRATTDGTRATLAKIVKVGPMNARIPFTVTIRDGYLIAMTTEYSAEVNNAVVPGKFAIRLTDFGKPVTVAAPPAKDVVSAPSS